MTHDEDRIIGSSAADTQRLCPLGLASWLVTVSPGHVIRLTFDRVKLGRGSSISVYDGDASSETVDMLAWSRGTEDRLSIGNIATGVGRQPVAEMVEEVWSTRNTMRIEYQTEKYVDESFHRRNGGEDAFEGFIAVYFAVEGWL
jgi:hypothetical protein